MEKHNLKIVWVGFHEEGDLCIEKLYQNGFSVAALITLDEEASAKRSGVYDYSEVAKKYQIPLYRVTHINNADSLDIIKKHQPDLMFVIGWSQILSEEVLGAVPSVVGTHASKLPHNRGSAPINWAIINGETSTGNTLIELAPGVDTGDILAQREFDISDYDSCKSLYRKVASTNAEMILELCESFLSGNVKRTKQDLGVGNLLPRRKPEHGKITWSDNAKVIYNFIRAQTRPYPGAFSYIAGKKCTIWKCSWSSAFEQDTLYEPGVIGHAVVSFDQENCGVAVGCSEGYIVIHEIQVDSEVLKGAELVDYMKHVDRFCNE